MTNLKELNGQRIQHMKTGIGPLDIYAKQKEKELIFCLKLNTNMQSEDNLTLTFHKGILFLLWKNLERMFSKYYSDKDATKSDCIEQNKIGKFQITWIIIEKDPTFMLWLFSHFIIVHAELMPPRKEIIEYTAYCDIFHPIKSGELIPEYVLEIHQEYDKPTGEVTMTLLVKTETGEKIKL